MARAPGTRLGPHEITAQGGVGGTGEVYRATDTKLDRDVAIKVLPASLAGDLERIARFQREAKTLAALNHPNIAQGAIPVDVALPIAKWIAEALEAAHRTGAVPPLSGSSDRTILRLFAEE